MAADKQAKMLERVRALLAKANSTNYPAEADAFRAKADALMTRYTIEQWQVDAAQDGVNGRPMPERRDFDFGWYAETPFRDQLWWVYCDLANHCRCKAVTSKIFRDVERQRKVPVIGLPADLDYLDMLFTSIMFDFTRKVDPKPDPDRLSYEENLAMLKEAGLGWPEITRLMVQAGMLTYKVTQLKGHHGGSFNEHGVYVAPMVDIREPWKERKNYAKPAHDYRNWCKREGRPQSYTDHRTYRRNFADGYSDALNTRLRAMRRDQREAYDGAHEAGGMDLVMRDIKHVINDILFAEFPDLAPHPDTCECADCHVAKCKDPKCDRPRCKARRKPVKYTPDNRKTDWAAREAGAVAGREVDIAGHQGRRVATPKKGLPS